MIQSQQHIIRQMELDFSTSAAEKQDYHALAERLSVLGTDHIPAILDRVLSELVPPGVYLRYDKIVLDCDLDHIDDLEAVIRTQLADQIEAVLHKDKPGATKVNRKENVSRVEKAPALLGPAEWVLHFLHHGHLPWSAPRDLEMPALTYELTELLAQDKWFARQLEQALSRPHCLKRMLLQFGAPMLLRLIAVLATAPDYVKRHDIAARSKKSELNPLSDQLKFWATELRLVVQSDTGRKLIPGTSKASASDDKQEHLLDTRVRLSREPKTEQAFYIKAAGLAILHPFLARFLRLYQAAEDKEVTDFDLAAALLHSLVSGASPSGEWDLVLPKVLLGLPVKTPLSLVQLTKEQLASGQELIEAAIEHWSALKATSAEGFRASFLQREGLLTPQGTDWYLQVEQAPYDMLLDVLPWNIAMIKLPWMTGMLRVEWGQN